MQIINCGEDVGDFAKEVLFRLHITGWKPVWSGGRSGYEKRVRYTFQWGLLDFEFECSDLEAPTFQDFMAKFSR